MRVFLLVLAVTFASNLALASTTTDHSTRNTIDNVHPRETGKRFLRSYDMGELGVKDMNEEEERGINLANLDDVIDVAKLDDLINPDKIKAALSNADDEAALFAKWHENPTMSKAIFQRLSANGNFLKNKDVVLKYSAYMTRLKNNKQLTPILDTKALDEALETLQTKGVRALSEKLEVWFTKGLTKEQLAAALKPYPDLAKKYKVMTFHYDNFVDYKNNLAKKAAAAAKKAAEAS